MAQILESVLTYVFIVLCIYRLLLVGNAIILFFMETTFSPCNSTCVCKRTTGEAVTVICTGGHISGTVEALPQTITELIYTQTIK